MKNGKLPFITESGNNILYRNGYFFVDGTVTMVDNLYPDMKEWVKVKAYITILAGKETMYSNLPKKGQDQETKHFIKLLSDKKFKSWVFNNPIINKEKQK